MADVERGWISDPTPLSTVDVSRPLTPRFALEQGVRIEENSAYRRFQCVGGEHRRFRDGHEHPGLDGRLSSGVRCI